MAGNTSRLITIGYEGRPPHQLLERLRDNGVSTLVDVRLTPRSRRRGLSKSALASALAVSGCRYVHLGALGNPPENRAGVRAGDARSIEAFRSYLLSRADGRAALEAVARLTTAGTVALLCYERLAADCHRNVIAEELRRLDAALEVEHLG